MPPIIVIQNGGLSRTVYRPVILDNGKRILFHLVLILFMHVVTFRVLIHLR